MIRPTYREMYDGKLNPDLDAMHELVRICELRDVFPYHIENRLTIFFRWRLSYETLAQTAIQEILRISYEIVERKTVISFE